MKQSSLVPVLLRFIVFPAYIIGLILACGNTDNKETDESIATKLNDSPSIIKDSSAISNVKFVVNYNDY